MRAKPFDLRHRTLLILTALVALPLLFAGCVAKQPEKSDTTEAPVFFPEPPDLPRYQFLKGYSITMDAGSEDEGLDSFLGMGKGATFKMKKPYGVQVAGGSIYIADTQNTVFKYDIATKGFGPIKGDKGQGKLVQPINLSIDEQGNKYVCDPVRKQVLKYDANDFYIKAYSSPDPWKPVDAEVYGDRLFVVDSTRGEGAVKVFDVETGEIVEVIGRSGKPEHQLAIPTNITIDEEGYLYIMDAGRFQIVKFDRDGHYRGNLGGPGSSPGFFARPRGVDLDRDGRMYAVDAAFDNVQVFATSGQVLTFFGGSGNTPGTLTLPAGIDIDYDHIDMYSQYLAPDFEPEYLIFVTSQFDEEFAVNVYAFGRKKGERYPSDKELYDELQERLLREQSAQ